MSKLKITEVKFFEQVTNIIGRKNAERELFIASQCEDVNFLSTWPNLLGAFIWGRTAQGHDFWALINKGINPYEK